MKTIFTFLLALLFLQPTYSQWQMMNSPLATPDIRKIAYHPDGNIIAITSANEVFQSDITQTNWNKVATLDSTAKSLAISTQGIIYVGIMGGYIFSSDVGVTWEVRELFPVVYENNYISDIGFNSLGHIFMTPLTDFTSPGVWKSTDNGISWNKLSNGLPANLYGFKGITIDTFDNLYILSLYGYVYKSTDSGSTWNLKTYISSSSNGELEIDSQNNIYLVLGAVYKSTDLGDTWIQISQVFTNGYIANLYVDSDNNLFGTKHSSNYGLLFSSDGGTNWVNFGLQGLLSYDVSRINNIIFIGTTRGMFKALDFGSDWSLCFKYDNRFVNINDMFVINNSKVLIASDEGLVISSNAGISWDITSITSNTRFLKKAHNGNIFASSDSLYRSTNGGTTWSKCVDSLTFMTPVNIANIFINDSNYIFIIKSPMIVDYSTDMGNSWGRLAMLIPYTNQTVRSYGIAENSGTVFYSYHFWGIVLGGWTEYKRMEKREIGGTSYQIVTNSLIILNIYFYNNIMYLATVENGMYKSYDDGTTLLPINNGLANESVKQIVLTDEVFIALTGDGIYNSLDQGNYWMRLDHTGLTGTINRIYYDDNKTLYACTDNGIYVFTGELPVELLSFTATAQAGSITLNWSTASELNNQGFEIQRKLKNTEWITIGFKEGKGTTTERNDYTYADDVAGINTSEVYYRLKQIDFDGTFTYSEEVKVGLIPFKYELYQNYPNPFNPTTKISWQSPVGSHQTLKVYDVLGNEVATLANEYKEAGSYEVEFDASSLASGMYIYKLSAGGFTSSRKMMVLK